jgi:hypothetical protein
MHWMSVIRIPLRRPEISQSDAEPRFGEPVNCPTISGDYINLWFALTEFARLLRQFKRLDYILWQRWVFAYIRQPTFLDYGFVYRQFFTVSRTCSNGSGPRSLTYDQQQANELWHFIGETDFLGWRVSRKGFWLFTCAFTNCRHACRATLSNALLPLNWTVAIADNAALLFNTPHESFPSSLEANASRPDKPDDRASQIATAERSV